MLNSDGERCQARSKRSKEQCKNNSVLGQRVCRMHGGQSLSGSACPAFRHGRYSKFLPQNLLQKFQDSLNDESILELEPELALLTTRIDEILETLAIDTNATKKRALWSEIADLVEQRRRLALTNLTKLKIQMHYVPLRDVLVMIKFLTDTIKQELEHLPNGQQILLKLNFQAQKMLGQIEEKAYR